MIKGGDEYAQNNKEGPLRVHRSYSKLKNKTNRKSHEEHRTRNNVGFDHSRDLAAPRLRFLFFLLLLSYFSQFPSLLNAGTPSQPPSTPIYRKKGHFGHLELAQAS